MSSLVKYAFLLLIYYFISSIYVENNTEVENLMRLKENSSCRIWKNIDLQGDSIKIPRGCTISFWGGSISNGIITFDATIIKGRPKFKNCTYNGTVSIERIDDRSFTSEDDTGTFHFLVNNAIKNGIRCDFYRDYKISMRGISSMGLVNIRSINSGAILSFHGHTVYNTYAFHSTAIRPIIVLHDVKNVTIRNLCFHDVDEHNSHNFAKSVGCNFILCYGDCEGINLLDCSQENGDGILRSGVYVHNSEFPNNTPHIGLSNSTLKVKARNTGHGLALYCGDNLDIDIEVDSPHRGLYCAGVSNSRIVYKGYNPKETHCHLLFKDAVYRTTRLNSIDTIDMKGCHDLTVLAIIEELLPNESVMILQSYGSGQRDNADFRFRSARCHHYNIDFSAIINKYPDKGYYVICNCLYDSGALNDEDVYGCIVSNITLHDIKNLSGTNDRYMCNVHPNVEAYITITDCDTPNSNISSNSGQYNFQIIGNATGKITVDNGLVGNILVRNKIDGKFEFDVKNSPATGKLNFINDGSLSELVHLNSSSLF